MKCEACGGDGQIEYGAYRGDEAGPTRECRLCGGVITQTAPLETLGVSAQSASGGLQRLAHSVSESGRRVTDLAATKAALQTARDVAAERLEQLKRENERRQREAEKHEHVWNHVQVIDGWDGDLTSRRVQFRCVGVGSNCSKVLEFNTGGGLITEDMRIAEPELTSLALRARNAALQDKTRRRERGML